MFQGGGCWWEGAGAGWGVGGVAGAGSARVLDTGRPEASRPKPRPRENHEAFLGCKTETFQDDSLGGKEPNRRVDKKE